MNKTSTRNSVLAGCGLLALTWYVLACRPAFSPDGTQVLFPALEAKTTNYTVSRYNLVTKKTDTIFTFASPKNTPIFSPQFLPDGKRVVIALGGMDDEDTLHVVLLPLGTEGPTRMFSFGDTKKNAMGLINPPPLLGNRMYVGGKGVHRLNLETGELKTMDEEAEFQVYRQGANLYYFGEFNEGKGDFELGKLDQETLVRTPILHLDKADAGNVNGFVSFNADGSRIALVSEKDDQYNLLIIAGQKLAQTIPVGSTNAPIKLGNTQWAADGKTIYATSLRPLAAADQFELGITEVSLDQKPLRHTPLLKLKEAEEQTLLLFQIALSPDGKTIVACSSYLDVDNKGGLNEPDRALFLIDVASPERKVTRIPLPSPGYTFQQVNNGTGWGQLVPTKVCWTS